MTKATKVTRSTASDETQVDAETWEGIPNELRPALEREIPAELPQAWHCRVTERIRPEVARVAKLREREALIDDELVNWCKNQTRARKAHRELVAASTTSTTT